MSTSTRPESTYETITVHPFGAALGAVIEGVDLRGAVSDVQRREIRDALMRHLVVAFRDQHLDDEQHLALAAALGVPHVHPMERLMGETEPTVGELDRTNDHKTQTDTWHLDVTYAPNPPAFGILRCLEAPPYGGDTMWANLYLAWQDLSEPFKERLIGLETVHYAPEVLMKMKSSVYGEDAIETWRRELSGVRHPVVRIHPETGEPCLFVVSRTSPIDGMSTLESNAILGVLEQHATSPNYTCRWHWTAGDVVVWDERCTAHFAVRDPWPGRRVVRRVLVEGDRPIAAS